MRDWRIVIGRLVHYKHPHGADFSPLIIFDARPPSGDQWPDGLLVSPAFQDFYTICDGGYIGGFLFPPLKDLAEKNRFWIEGLSNYYEYGPVLDSQRHLVLGEDAIGAALIWDSQTGHVATFFSKGGDWEPPLAASVEEFLTQIANPTARNDDSWTQALEELDQLYD